MLDRDHIALQCALLSAQAYGIAAVEDYRHYQRPEATQSRQQAVSSVLTTLSMIAQVPRKW